MRKAIVLVAILLSSSMAAGPAEAATWLTPGAGCVVRADHVGLAQQVFPYAEFRPTATGQIVLYCPVTAGNGGVEGPNWKLDLYYRDTSATADGDFVRVELVKMNLGTGIESPVPGCPLINSDPSVSPGYTIRTLSCSENFDPDTFAYYARVTIDRSSTTQTMRFYGLALYL
jgi:hypothetical protein